MNEEASLGGVLEEVKRALADWDFDILIVDTNSKDRTREIAVAAGARVVDEPRRGYGRAYKTGFAEATGELIATLDADLTYPADRIPEFARLVLDGEADFVSGDRLSELEQTTMTGMHSVGNSILNVTFRLLFRYPIRDSQSGMWVFRRALVDQLTLTHDGMPLSEEIKVEAIRHGRFREVPIAYRERVGEKKIRSFQDAFTNEIFLVRKRAGWVSRP